MFLGSQKFQIRIALQKHVYKLYIKIITFVWKLWRPATLTCKPKFILHSYLKVQNIQCEFVTKKLLRAQTGLIIQVNIFTASDLCGDQDVHFILFYRS